jgi:hypothetical protein
MRLFLRDHPGGFESRRPPFSVVSFIESCGSLPSIIDVIPKDYRMAPQANQ